MFQSSLFLCFLKLFFSNISRTYIIPSISVSKNFRFQNRIFFSVNSSEIPFLLGFVNFEANDYSPFSNFFQPISQPMVHKNVFILVTESTQCLDATTEDTS